MNDDDKLDDWGEIAAHINRSLRTAPRWNKQLEMPVHVIPHPGRNVVYSLRSEIDEWLEKYQKLRAERAKRPEWQLLWTVAATLVAVALSIWMWVLPGGTVTPH